MNSDSSQAAMHAQQSPWLKRILFAFGSLALVAALGAFAPRLFKTSPRVKHLTHTVARGTLQVIVTENGAVESSNNKEIKCLVKGGSTVLWVIETGTMVKPGEELVRLDQSTIEDNILRQQIVYENALANKISAESDVSVAEISIKEYLESTFQEDRSVIEKEIFDSEQSLRKSELSYESATRLAAKGTLKNLQLEGEKFLVDSAKKDLDLKKMRLLSPVFWGETDGTGIEQLTHDDRVNWFPHISPDGKWIVYISFPPGTVKHPANKDVILRRMRPDGSEQADIVKLFGGQGTINVNSWSPNSQRFAYVAYPVLKNEETK